jgi:hypothetical protein
LHDDALRIAQQAEVLVGDDVDEAPNGISFQVNGCKRQKNVLVLLHYVCGIGIPWKHPDELSSGQ